MIYNENGIKLSKSNNKFILEDINDIKNSINNLVSLMEYETIAKASNGFKDEMKPDSTLNNDVFTSRQKKDLGKINEALHYKILESENICKEYELWANCDLNNVINRGNEWRNELIRGVALDKSAYGRGEFLAVEHNINVIYNNLLEKGYSEKEIRKYILTEFYDISDDPEHIKKFLHLRLNYNKKMISIFKKMLSLNYEILNLTKEQADDMANNMDIDQVKNLILQNKSKFIKRKGRFYDLRELGFGVAFIQNGKTNLEGFTSLEHILPYLMRYDVTFLTHGAYNSVNITNIFNKEFIKEVKEWIKYTFKYSFYYGQLQGLQGLNPSYISLETKAQITDLQRKIKDLQSSMNDKYEYGEDALFGPLRENSRWTCMPIRTESAGPFTDVNKLITQCVKEARQNKMNYNLIKSNNKNVHIMVMCCNPGAIPVSRAITSQKDVHIHYAKTSVMPESNILNSSYDDIYLCEQNLKQFCTDIGIDYNDDEYLNECAASITDEDISMLYEMSIKELWNSAVSLAKKIWAAIVSFFKMIIDFFKDIIRKIKIAIQDKDADVQDVSYITMESARVAHSKDITLGRAEYEIEKACSSIAKSINRLEQQQTSIMKKINDDLTRKSNALH